MAFFFQFFVYVCVNYAFSARKLVAPGVPSILSMGKCTQFSGLTQFCECIIYTTPTTSAARNVAKVVYYSCFDWVRLITLELQQLEMR